MTLDDIFEIYLNGVAAHIALTGDAGDASKRAGIRAVVTALRDEIVYAPAFAEDILDKILASDGVAVAEQSSVAEADHLRDATKMVTPAADPSVCEWTDTGETYDTTCAPRDVLIKVELFKFCPSCGRPISFKEAAR